MSFSARQQHCLEAMGIVPWTSRHVVQQSPAQSAPEQLLEHASDIPADLHELGAWLPSQRLADFGYKGAVHTVLGHPEASVLVVTQRQENHTGELPLSGDAAQLFELMMRSIELGRSDFRQCSLTIDATQANNQADGIQTVGAACTAQTRAILILMTTIDSNDTAADAHHCRLADSQLPVWRIAHPQILLQENQRKRQAWQAIKALQHNLATSVSQ